MSRRHLSRFALLTIVFAAGTFAAAGGSPTAASASPPCQAKKGTCPPDGTTTTPTTTTTATTTSTTATTATTTGGTAPAPTPTIVTKFLSDLSWTAAVNGWGPVERDMSNGELGFADGRTLTLNGETFPKGLGAHGRSEIRYAVPAGCSRFTASVGVDDEVGSRGSMAFQVFVGTTRLYDSGTMTGLSATKLVDLAVSGGAELRLVIADAADGVDYDHGDWAAARLTCTSSTSSTSTATTTTTAATATTATTTATTTTTVAAPTTSAGVAAPQGPSAYAPPVGAIYVRSASELTSALAQSNRDIVLADGTYSKSGPFVNAGGNRLYAERVGGAVLTSGLVVGGNSAVAGSIVRGIIFDVSSAAATLQGSIVHVWGPGGVNAQILDCVFRGNRAVPYGIGAPNPSGMVAKRLRFYGFTDVAFRASDNQVVGYGAATPRIGEISDIDIDGVTRSVPGSSNGTAEAGLWIGHPVTNGVRRVRVRNVSWSGIETVNNSWGTTFSDLDIDMSGPSQYAGVAVYMEHYNYYNVFTNFRIAGAKIGFTAEWADPSWGGKPGANYVTIRGGVIDALGSTLAGRQAGVYLDEGSNSTTVQDVVFRNQNWAGIGAYRNVGTNSFGANQYSLKSGAVQISYDHI